jgi:hypothetical protein
MLNYLWRKSRDGSLDRLSASECLTAYGTTVQSARRNLLVVTTDNGHAADRNTSSLYPLNNLSINNTNLHLGWDSRATDGLNHYLNEDPLAWICSGIPGKKHKSCQSRLAEVRNAPRSWQVAAANCYASQGFCDRNRWSVDYCLSERVDSRCRLHFSPTIAIIVTSLNLCKSKLPSISTMQIRSDLSSWTGASCNVEADVKLGKAVLMLIIVYTVKENPLLTMGDAVASFLDDDDTTTDDMGLVSIHDIKKGYSAVQTTWDNPRHRWKDATSKRRRTVALVLYSRHTSRDIELANNKPDSQQPWSS